MSRAMPLTTSSVHGLSPRYGGHYLTLSMRYIIAIPRKFHCRKQCISPEVWNLITDNCLPSLTMYIMSDNCKAFVYTDMRHVYDCCLLLFIVMGISS